MITLFDAISYISWGLMLVSALKVSLFLYYSSNHYFFHKNRDEKLIGKYMPLISVIIPSFNEEKTLENCISSLLNQTYQNFEIIIVDDGSTDGTARVGRELEFKFPNKVVFFSKVNGGKASALNYGLFRSTGEIVISMDADSIFTPDTIHQIVLSFYDPDMVAVGGNVKVANRDTHLGKNQALEYISGLNLQRRAFAHAGCMQVISGAIGAFRKQELLSIGGYSSDTIVEDMDVTISLARKGYKTGYNPMAIAYTEAPEDIKSFIKQRSRWVFGGFQVLKKHKDTIFNPKYGTLGVIGVPYFLIFPWVDVLISVIFFGSILRAVFIGCLGDLAVFYIAMSSLQAALSYYSLKMDNEDIELNYLSYFESLWYCHIISYAILKAGITYAVGSDPKWNKLPRLGKNSLPVLN